MPVARPLPAAHDPRSGFSLVVAVVGLAGVASIVLPFTYNVSPFGAAGTLFSRDSFLGELWRLGIPFLLAILVTAGAFRLALSGRFTRTERLVGYLAAMGAACCLLSIFLPYGSNNFVSAPSGAFEWFMTVFPWMASAAGIALVWRNAQAGVPEGANVIAAMELVYVTVAVICLVSYAGEWQIGACLVALTTLVYLAQIAAVSVAAPRHPAPAPK